MTPTQIKRLITKIEKHKQIVAKQRDSLREILDDLEGLQENWDSAVEGLDIVIDQLSELV